MHVAVNGPSPESLAIVTVEPAEARFHDFVVEYPEDGCSRPLVLQDHCPCEERVVLEMKEDSEIMEVAAQVQCFGAVEFHVPAVNSEILLLRYVGRFGCPNLDARAHFDPAGG